MEYLEFLKSKQHNIVESGFDVNEIDLNVNLFDFQKYIVKTALKKGRYAIFAECGLGKTLMQLEWAYKVSQYTKMPVLIFTPLAVSKQTINEGLKFGIEVSSIGMPNKSIYVTNYEQIENINPELYSGIVLDESSILKNFTGKMKNKLIELFKNTQYKLCCTATPSPNDMNEIGNHSEFLNILDSQDMRSKWFVRDEGLNNYRLKGHAEDSFFDWIGSWSVFISNPNEIGFNSVSFELPKLNIIDNNIRVPIKTDTELFNQSVVNATNFNRELRNTMELRLNKVAEIANSNKENYIIWIKLNDEADILKKLIPGAVEVRGNEKPEIKELKLLGFAKNEFRVLITKPKIAQFGLNYQNCHNQIFASLDFSFESLYQSIRRSYRFGQEHEVTIHLITTDTMQNVINIINIKQESFNKLREKVKMNNESEHNIVVDYEKKEYKSDLFKIINGDSIEEMKYIESNSIDFSVFSPPFSNLFTYSNSIRDLGNCNDDAEFFEQNEFLLAELYRIIKQGRLVAVHTKDLAKYKNSSGYSGMSNFTGMYHLAMEKAGFKYHSKVTIWNDPVLEMQRTKTQRLLYKQLTTDSSYSGIGMPDYVTIFRKWEGNEENWEPVDHLNKQNISLDTWQKWASPIWLDIQRTDVLRASDASEVKDEKHICPLQLGVIERLIMLYSNPNELVFTPFLGIGSELYEAIRLGRKGLGIELKESYYLQALSNLKNIENKMKNEISLFDNKETENEKSEN